MKIERVSENKIKVIISVDDLEERNIDLNSLSYNSPAAQELFWDMMEQAEILFGFNASDSQLCIEAIPNSEEGFIIMITKFEVDGEFEAFQKYVKNRFKRAELKAKRKNRRLFSPLLIYSFGSLDDICELSQKSHKMFMGESTLYKFKETYYLIFTRNSIPGHSFKAFELLLTEYGNKIQNVNLYEGYLSEHGQKIIERNALEILYTYY